MKQIWQDLKPCIVMAVIAMTLSIAALIWVAVDKRDRGEPLDLPSPDEVTVCYYIHDLDKPHEQIWYGGEALEDILTELAALEFTETDESPPEGAFRAALVVATNQEQITVLWDREYRAWVYDEERGWRRECKFDR